MPWLGALALNYANNFALNNDQYFANIRRCGPITLSTGFRYAIGPTPMMILNIKFPIGLKTELQNSDYDYIELE